MTVTHMRTCLLDPYDYDFHEDPYPYYKRLRDEAPLYRNDELGFWALSRHAGRAAGLPQQHDAVESRGRVARSGLPRTARVQDHVVPRHGRSGHLRLRTLVSKGFTPRRIRELEPRVTEIAVQHLDVMIANGRGRHGATTWPNSQASCRWTSSPS